MRGRHCTSTDIHTAQHGTAPTPVDHHYFCNLFGANMRSMREWEREREREREKERVGKLSLPEQSTPVLATIGLVTRIVDSLVY